MSNTGGRVKQHLPRDDKYLDFLPIKKSKGADIWLIPTRKGTGKTYQAIRNGLINKENTGMPFAYIRSTKEQLMEFTAQDKFFGLINDLGYQVQGNHNISSKLFYKLGNKSKNNKTRGVNPISYFVAVNQAMNIQSSKFQPISLAIVDEVQHHFMETSAQVVNKLLNVLASIMRNHNAPIWTIFNQVNKNDLLLQKLKVNRQIDKVKEGQVRRFRRTFMIDGEMVELMVGIWKPKIGKEWKEENKKSVASKLSAISDYGSVINSDDFYIKDADVKFIDKLGDFKGTINANGFKMGLWMKKDGTYQFSSRYNKTGKVKYFSYGDYLYGSEIGSFETIKDFKMNLIKNNIEFEDGEIFQQFLSLVKTKRTL